MEETVYCIVRETYLDGKENRTAYGIAACEGDTKTVLASVHDCGVDFETISAFATFCNENRLPAEDLEEAVSQKLFELA